MAIASNPGSDRPSSFGQKARTLFSPSKTTWNLFMIFAFFVGGLFASYFTGNVVGIIVFGIPFIVIVFPFSLVVASLFPDAASVAVSVPFVFAYLYLLSCLISYGLQRRKHLNRVVT